MPFQVNCAGVVDEEFFFETKSSRNDYYLIYLQKGKLIMPEGALLPGDYVLFEPGYTYNYHSTGNTSYLFVHFSGTDVEKYTKKHIHETRKITHIGIHQSINERFEALFKEFMIHDNVSDEISVCLLKEIIALIGRHTKKPDTQRTPLKSLQYINKNFSHDIPIETLADMEKIGLTTYRKIFKKHTGMSPVDYIISLRISSACHQLIHSHNSIAAIASNVGYNDPYYFSRIFKKRIGISPQKYRKGTPYF